MIEGVDKSPIGHTDAGAGRSERHRPCSKRFAPGRWCTREDNHSGACDGPEARVYPHPVFAPGDKPR